MDEMKIAKIVSAMSGIPMEELLPRMPLIILSTKEVLRMVKEEQEIEQHQDLLDYICAANAWYRYCLTEDAAVPKGSFSAGGISVSTSDDNQAIRAKNLRDELWASANFLLKYEDDFYFSTTGGES
ncbi:MULTISPECIES: hypothetical protein [Clostridiaceae]|uniref:Phage gp6-like head-tail connector protein n=1 Tax=Clostridium facile TaxID=2763035 RepID=A0ABR7IS17_9CLOT|nr:MULTISPECIES: hypothetical protein [Clostridiaceae]MBC5787937.1 hypothetical protein [Clostridium facile]PWM98635.1 MAG: hypothetical protein DBX37_06370 [Massilioclostridium sp.]